MIRKNKIVFRTKEKLLHAYNLNCPNNKIELYLHYLWGSNVDAQYQNVRTEKKLKGALADHISFHHDGHVHYKIRNEKGKVEYLERFQIGLNPFNLERNNYLPIYLESFDLSDYDFNNIRFKVIELIDNSDIVFNISDLKSFSILLVSKCAKVNPSIILEQLGLNQKLLIDEPLIITDFFTAKEKVQNLGSSLTEFNTELLIIVFRKIIPKTLLLYLEPNQEEIENLNTFRVLPQLKLINEMLMSV